MEFTPSQQKAVVLEGDSLLVSAAAGSGKTAVLTSRVIRKLCDSEHPCDADRLMILTFTTAAATEMRRRITKEFERLIHENPSDEHLRRQLMLLPGAKICTIHSACLDIIRKGFQLIDLDPQFTIAEESRLELMKEEMTDDFIEKLYERAEQDNRISELIDYFTRGRDDGALRRAVDYGTDFLLNEPYADAFIERTCTDISDTVFDGVQGRALKELLLGELSDICNKYDKLVCHAQELGVEKLVSLYDTERDNVMRIAKFVCELDFDGAVINSSFEFARHPSKPKDFDAQEWAYFKDSRTELKDRFIKLRDEFLHSDTQTVIADRKSELCVIKTFLTLCSELNVMLATERKRQHMLSFDDIEKYTLKLLIESVGEDGIIKTPLARSLANDIDEIIVDEYQDCNRTQELIFTALSREGKNIFTVGDVKQSIYRFRKADPEVFLNRAKNSDAPQGDTLVCPSVVNLSCNFRSHGKVLDFVNAVFDPLMTDKNGGISYKDGHRLEKSELYDSTESAGVNITLLVTDGVSNDGVTALTRAQAEAEYVAGKIKSIIGRKTVYDAKLGSERYITASDIAILMRAPKGSGAIYERALERYGIGFINNNPSEKYLDTPEVRNVLAFLQVLDNPYEDIPLITLMYSDFFGFSADKLGAIRAGGKNMLFFDAVKKYAKVDKQTADFTDCIESLRRYALTTDVYGIINAVYEKSGILLRETDPSVRANLMLLLDLASEFESTRYRGMFAFINYMGKLAARDSTLPAAKLKKADNCVNILSIHKSKGLEFPVVFLVNTANHMYIDSPAEILLDSNLGAGGFVRDKVSHRNFSSVYRNLIKENSERADKDEYMRFLYVALTRACSYMYITASAEVKTAEKVIRTASALHGDISTCDIYSNPSFFKWMMFALIDSPSADPFKAFAGVPIEHKPKDGLFTADILDMTVFEADIQSVEKVKESVTLDPDYVKAQITRRYKYEQSTYVPVKLSVSEIKGARMVDNEVKNVFEKRAAHKKPRFMQNGVTGADRGNATHAFLQYCDFNAVSDGESLEKEAKRLVENRFVTQNDMSLVDKDKVLHFLNSDIMKSLTALGTCRKEDRFLMTLPAREVTDIDADEQVIVQGIIDCWYVRDNKAVIVDYKTDYVKTADELVKRYSIQLDLYARAIEKIHGHKTAHKYIYSFCLEQFVEI